MVLTAMEKGVGAGLSEAVQTQPQNLLLLLYSRYRS